MSEKRSWGQGNPEARAESEFQSSMQRDLDSLTPQEESFLFARLESLDVRHPDFKQERERIVSITLTDIKLQRRRLEGEIK